MEFILYFATLLWDFSPKRGTENKKNSITLQQKTKQLSLQQNDCRPSRSRATQRFLVRPRAFFGAVSPSGSLHTRLAEQGASTARNNAYSQ